jgi:hypothetical protein
MILKIIDITKKHKITSKQLLKLFNKDIIHLILINDINLIEKSPNSNEFKKHKIYIKKASSTQEKYSKITGFLSSIYKEIVKVEIKTNDFELLSKVNQILFKKNIEIIDFEIKYEKKIKNINTILFFDLENVCNKTDLNNFYNKLNLKEDKFKQITISTHDTEFFNKYLNKIFEWSDNINYFKIEKGPNAADKMLIKELQNRIKCNQKEEYYALLSNDNGLIEEFVTNCVKHKKTFKLYTTIIKYPIYIKTNKLEKYTTII